MNKGKLEKEIGQMHDNLNKTMALLRGVSTVGALEEGNTVDAGLICEVATKILQEDVYQRLERLPKILEEKANE